MSLYFALALFMVLFFVLRLRSVFTFVTVLFLVLIMRSGVFIVNEGSQVVITQFGRIIGKPYTEAGLYFKVPFFWKANYFDKRIFSEEDLEVNVATKDMYFIGVETVANWRISNAAIFYENMDTVAEARVLLKNIISGSVREVISRYKLVDTVRAQDSSLKTAGMDGSKKNDIGIRAEVQVGRERINQLMKDEIADYARKYGIEVMAVLIRNVSYGPAVENNIYERMILERLTKAEEMRSTGRKKYQSVLGQIEREFQNIMAPARKEAELIRGQAEAEATAIYAEAYVGNEAFYNFWRTLLAYQEGLPANNQATVLTTDSSFLHLLTNRYAFEKPH